MKLAITEILPDPLRNVLDNLVAAISSSWEVEHTEAGQHRAVTASGDVISQGMGSFYNQPRCRVTKRGTNQTIPNATDTFLTFLKPKTPNGFPEDGYDLDGMFDQDGSGMYFAPKEKGLYLMEARIRFVANAVGQRYAAIAPTQAIDEYDMAFSPVNSGTYATSLFLSTIIPHDPAPGGAASSVTAPVRYRIYVFQDSGGNLDVMGSSLATWVQVTKLS